MGRFVLAAFSMSLICLFVGAPSCGDDDDDDDAAFDASVGDDDGGGDDDDNATGDTWTDPSSGLNWQVTPSDVYLNWEEATFYCDSLSLDSGGWHLPTISQLRTLIRGCDTTVTGGSCGVTDDCLDDSCQDDPCVFCEYGDGPNNGCYGPTELPDDCEWFWSSSPVSDTDMVVWGVDFYDGDVRESYGDLANGVARCVR